MNYRGVLVVFGVLGAGLTAMAGCSGPDQGVITFSERPSQGAARGDNDNGSPAPAAPTSTGSTTPANPVFASDAFPAVNPACGTCHLSGANGAPIFFGPSGAAAATADATYPLFKAKGYHQVDSLFVTKGLHAGPALTPEQRAAVDKWVAAEGGGPDGG
ncbi:MAG: hypothetical protein KF764_28555 [Labilithrix sp.]|nr:hypothetical protein [Labilithrix sp.]MBX3220338.1 hypothetical protein [Labilithrix sp.]